MKIEKCRKESFEVIGKEGSTLDGQGFIQKLWAEANANFDDVKELAKMDGNGNFVGFWGAMSDLAHTYQPWEDGFSKGLYLAGVECVEGAIAPNGWTKWRIPGYEYLKVEVEHENLFIEVINYINENNLNLVGAVHDFTCPKSGVNYMFFPISKL